MFAKYAQKLSQKQIKNRRFQIACGFLSKTGLIFQIFKLTNKFTSLKTNLDALADNKFATKSSTFPYKLL